MNSFKDWAGKTAAACVFAVMATEAMAITIDPNLNTNGANVDMGVYQADIEFGAISGSVFIGNTDTINGIGVATFETTNSGTATIVIDPAPPLPEEVPDNNYEVELWEIDSSGDFFRQLGTSLIGTNSTQLQFNSVSLAANTLYAIVLGNNGAIGAAAVALTNFDGVQITVPVPAAVLLFIGGLASMFGWRRRQRSDEIPLAIAA